jgi:extradiol dioxygenase family protein
MKTLYSRLQKNEPIRKGINNGGETMSQYDIAGLHEFLMHTPEQGLRKMLVDGKPMTDVHFGMVLKIARACKWEDFASHVDKNDFPKIKFGPAEIKIKEKFWKDCFAAFESRGILNPAVTKVA